MGKKPALDLLALVYAPEVLVCLVTMKTLLLLSAILLSLVALFAIFTLQGSYKRNLKKRWTHDNSHLRDLNQDHNHPWMNNAWYKYVYDRTRTDNSTECYVCSHMPTTAIHATIYGMAPELDEAMCIFNKAITGNCSRRDLMTTGLALKGQSTKKKDQIPWCNDTDVKRVMKPISQQRVIFKQTTHCAYNLTNWNYACDEEHWVNVNANNTKSRSFAIVLPPDIQHPICFAFSDGSRKVGRNLNCTQTFAMTQSTGTLTFKNGTLWVQGAAWACGPKTYFMLPPNSTGLCAPVLISDHTFKITAETHARISRAKREVAEVLPHDSVYGSDVPKNFKLWTTGQKVLHSLFPWVGTGKNMLRIETLDYRFGLFLNASVKINKAQNEEIDAIRIVVMQHRVALDMILAEKGGLCVLFNTTCCTYIPDNVHSQNMTDALNALRKIRDAQQQDYVTSTEDWLTWLLSGSWKSLLIKGLVFVGILLLLLCVFTTCVIPCLKKMVSNIVMTSINAYVILPQMEDVLEKDSCDDIEV